MKKVMKKVKIILLGSFTGNNAGDMVVLESIIHDFNQFLFLGAKKTEASMFVGMEYVTEIELIVPGLNKKGLEFIINRIQLERGMKICPIPITKNPVVVTRAIVRLWKEFPKADYIYTTAGILFDQKIWNPFYNFVLVYTPLLQWAKLKNPKGKIIGYNVGITSNSRTVGKILLKKCIMLHDRIYLREERDVALLEQFQYKGELFFSTDNVFGYGKPKSPSSNMCHKIYINLTLYGVPDKQYFVQEITRLVCKLKCDYEVCFFQTSKRDLEIAKEVCQKAHLGEACIYYLSFMGYYEIENLLSECDILIGMRMHSLIFALKGGCPVIAMGYSQKVASMMQDMHLEKFLVAMDDISEHVLLSKVAAVSQQRKELLCNMYEELEKRYYLCNRYK